MEYLETVQYGKEPKLAFSPVDIQKEENGLTHAKEKPASNIPIFEAFKCQF